MKGTTMTTKVHKLLLVLIIILSLSSCATTVKIETNGIPVPNHITRAHLPSSGIVIESALIKYYYIKEGSELLEAFDYLNPHKEEQVLDSEYLREFEVVLRVINPNKIKYGLWVNREVHAKDKTFVEKKVELIYNGSLSMKEFNIKLPVHKGSWGKAYYEFRDAYGNLMFQGLDIRYLVTSTVGSK
jgi:hypothetical protein